MRKKSSIWIFVALVFIVPATAFAIVNWYEKKIKKLPVYYSIVDENYGQYQFLNQENGGLLAHASAKPNRSLAMFVVDQIIWSNAGFQSR